MNVPPLIGMALSINPVLVGMLDDISVRSLHDLLEVQTIDAHNRRIIQKAERGNKGDQ